MPDGADFSGHQQHAAHGPAGRLRRGGGIRAARRLWGRAGRFALLPECAAILGFIALIWASVWFGMANQYATDADAAAQATGNLARAFEESTARIAGSIDQILLSLRASYADDPEHFNLVAWERRQTRADRLTIQFAIIDSNGVLVDSTLPIGAGRVALADREHFQAHLDPARDGLFISRPVLGRASGKWSVQFTRKLVAPDGSFAGVAVVSLDCDALSRFYQTLDIGQGVVILAGTDGIVRARGPMLEAAIGAGLGGRPFFHAAASQRASSFLMTSRFDGVERIVSSRRLADYPLIVLVGFDTGAVFRSYTAHLHRSEITAGIATLVVLLLGGFWIRQRLRSVASNAALEVTLEAISQGIVMVDGRGNVPVVNSRAVELLDLPPGTRRMAASGDLRLPGGAMPDSGTVTEMSGPDGRIIEVHASATPSGGSVMSYTDVTGRRADEARIMHLALHDGLTGLANRTLLHERIAGAVADAETTQGQFAVISMDIDSFGDVNDSLGHGMGDLLLTSVAARLRALVRPCDTVARVGGDEFAIVAVCADAGAALQIARRVTESLAAPVDLAGHAWLLSAGAGVAMFPADGLGTEDLLRSADMALCRAKSDGRGTVRRYEAWMAQSVQDRLLLERDLRLALERGELEVYMQPQFSCETMRVTGFEALARWRHPVRGMVPPGVFIPVAEECGLIVAVGRLMLERACELAAAWRPKCSVAVNLSPIQFRDAGLPDLLAGILRRTGLDAGLLELEVTEGVLINDAEQALGSLRALKALGVRLALDDFGTGYSSLSYLRRFPFDRIKIDKTFVQAQEHDDGTRAILEAVLAMSSRLNIAVIAEGVETEDQLQMLRGQGCGEVQGFLLARPMPSADVQAFLSAADGGALSRRVSPSVIPVSARGMAAAPTLVPARAA